MSYLLCPTHSWHHIKYSIKTVFFLAKKERLKVTQAKEIKMTFRSPFFILIAGNTQLDFDSK